MLAAYRFLLPLALGGCFPTGLADERAELRANHERWRAQGIASYSYVVQQSCFCPSSVTEPLRVTVRQGEVVAVAEAATLAPRAVDRSRALTVEDLFARVEDALDRGAAGLSVTYHPERGYPTSISIDYDERAIDEEISFAARDLRILD